MLLRDSFDVGWLRVLVFLCWSCAGLSLLRVMGGRAAVGDGAAVLHYGRDAGGLVHELSRSTSPTRAILSSSVNHAAADALVAAAASVWNVPTASLVLSQGGTLDEHVSGANTFLGPVGADLSG